MCAHLGRLLFPVGSLDDWQVLRVESVGDFWAAAPAKLVEWQGRMLAATSKLYGFLTMDPDERGCVIRRQEGHRRGCRS